MRKVNAEYAKKDSNGFYLVFFSKTLGTSYNQLYICTCNRIYPKENNVIRL